MGKPIQMLSDLSVACRHLCKHASNWHGFGKKSIKITSEIENLVRDHLANILFSFRVKNGCSVPMRLRWSNAALHIR